MTSRSDLVELTPQERRDYGFARVRDSAFDAVCSLWARRQSEGMTQADLAAAIDVDAGWLSRNLSGPGNWTLRTFGALVEGLRGEAEISVRALEDPLPVRSNYHAYVEYPIAGPSCFLDGQVVASLPSKIAVAQQPAKPMLITLSS